jgi:hypothetical protein
MRPKIVFKGIFGFKKNHQSKVKPISLVSPVNGDPFQKLSFCACLVRKKGVVLHPQSGTVAEVQRSDLRGSRPEKKTRNNLALIWRKQKETLSLQPLSETGATSSTKYLAQPFEGRTQQTEMAN